MITHTHTHTHDPNWSQEEKFSLCLSFYLPLTYTEFMWHSCTMCAHSPQTYNEVFRIEGLHTDAVTGLLLLVDNDGKWIWSGSKDKSVCVWRTSNELDLQQLRLSHLSITNLLD